MVIRFLTNIKFIILECKVQCRLFCWANCWLFSCRGHCTLVEFSRILPVNHFSSFCFTSKWICFQMIRSHSLCLRLIYELWVGSESKVSKICIEVRIFIPLSHPMLFCVTYFYGCWSILYMYNSKCLHHPSTM